MSGKRITLANAGGAVPQIRSDRSMVEAVERQGRREQLQTIRLDLIDPSPHQHRLFFGTDEDLRALGASFGDDGRALAQPPVVRPKPDGRFELVVGERRVRAARARGLSELPFRVRELTDDEAREATATENLARADLLDWEEAQACLDLRALAQQTGRKNAGAGVVAELLAARGGAAPRRSAITVRLRVAEALPKLLMQEAGALDPDVLPALGIDSLDAVARLPEAQRLDALRDLVATVRGSETARSPRSLVPAIDPEAAERPTPMGAAVSQQPSDAGVTAPSSGAATPSPYARAMATGFRKNIRAAVDSLVPSDAARHLTDMAPVVAALAVQAGGGAPTQRIPVDGAPVDLWALPTAASVGSMSPRQLLDALKVVEPVRDALRRAALRHVPNPFAESLGMEAHLEALARRQQLDALTPGQRAIVLAIAASHLSKANLPWSSTSRGLLAIPGEALAAAAWTRKQLDDKQAKVRSALTKATRRMPDPLHLAGGTATLHCSDVSRLGRPLNAFAGRAVTLQAWGDHATLEVTPTDGRPSCHTVRLAAAIPAGAPTAVALWWAATHLASALDGARGTRTGIRDRAADAGLTVAQMKAVLGHRTLVIGIAQALAKRTDLLLDGALALHLLELDRAASGAAPDVVPEVESRSASLPGQADRRVSPGL